jgi:redox-sensitive bicupin YhaK (pirin superfamily)
VKLRKATRTVQSQETSDGAGVRLRRTIGTLTLDHLDPFLLLDEFKSDRPGDYIAGFPDHAHRGFETVTYMLAGHMEHRDHTGHRGNLEAGSIQWMTAGRGIIHSEMPRQEEGLMWGFQLWVNLPAKHKMTEPRYQDIPPGNIPEVMLSGARVRVLAGAVDGQIGPITGIVTEPTYLDISLEANSRFTYPIARGHTAFAYIFEGTGHIGAEATRPPTPAHHVLVLEDGEGIEAVTTDVGMRFLLLAAKPIGEPIARYGPFVMNTEQELVQAFRELQNGTFIS